MATKTKWFFFWLTSGSFLAGILAVCGLVSAVNWLGTETFCSTGCHTMNGVAYAWKQGSHARTPSGKTADCSDCHLYNASENTLGPLGYISLLGHKVVSASHSAYGQIIGHFDTPVHWVEQRPAVEAQAKQWFVDNNYHTCRGCHDLSRMYDPKNPGIGAWHALYQDQTLDCLACHKDVGHNYKQVDAYIAENQSYPPLDEAWVFPVAATTSASPMPPQNLTPEQLKKDAQPWNPSAVSSASTAAKAPAINQSKDVEQIAKKLNKEIREPFPGTQQNSVPSAAPQPQANSSASTPVKEKTQNVAPAPAPKAQATSSASTKANGNAK